MDSTDFIIDTLGDTSITTTVEGSTSGDDFLKELFNDIEMPPKEQRKKVIHKENDLLTEVLDDLYRKGKNRKRSKAGRNGSPTEAPVREEVTKIMKKSVLTPEFEKLNFVPPYEISEKNLREQRKKEREKTKGKKWYGLPATEMTEEIKNDLEVLQMRSVLDPKHFYKKNDLKVLPKYFQVGKVMDSSVDFYSSRIPKKLRKKTLVGELLADAQFQKYNKRKYKEIIEEKQKTHYKAWRQARKLKKKK
ncbi:unnamed protein product [Phaedon cochleariae]|uniref:Fcf2 pre-rRNA processing C-terminal domain-containing protein n=1 Tax=Phaedon cochleariae TaxID=80249 RepID=A0A9P0DXE1_PHACE|nr:unnamed protein product [Phaedon cochleariae]